MASCRTCMRRVTCGWRPSPPKWPSPTRRPMRVPRSNWVGKAGSSVVSPSCYTGNIRFRGGRSDAGDEGVYIGFGGVEGGHPADDASVLVPQVEGPVLLERGDVGRVEAGEDAVGLDRMDDLDARYGAGAVGQPTGHGVGVGRVSAPQ